MCYIEGDELDGKNPRLKPGAFGGFYILKISFVSYVLRVFMMSAEFNNSKHQLERA